MMELSNNNRNVELSSSTDSEKNLTLGRWPSSANSRTFATSTIISSSNKNRLAQELFCEACSALYSDILNAVDHHSEINENDILCRQMEIIKQGAELSNAFPQLSSLITSKLSTINRAMEHLKLNRQSVFDDAENVVKEEEPTALSELRKWLQTMGEKLSKMEAKFTRTPLAREELDRLAADQQILQLQIETEGHTLVQNVQRTLPRCLEESEAAVEYWVQRRQRHLKILTQRWYHLWIRSLSVQYRIERLLYQPYPGVEETENDPALREPQVKRRRYDNNDRKSAEWEELDGPKVEEDIIPFAEEEYESIDRNTMPQTEEEQSWESEERMKLDGSTSSATIASSCYREHQSDNDNLCTTNSNCLNGSDFRVGWPPTTDIDEQRRQRIHCSPVKSFYKTVPLDETGATDTETPRVSMSGWPAGNFYPTDMHVLTDSLIVNTEEEPEMDPNDEIKKILSMLNDDENGNPQQGTRWHEFKCGTLRYQLPFNRSWLLGSVDNSDKHSCDASSEESDDLPTDISPVTMTKAATPPASDSRHCSLKRRRKGRLSISDRFPFSFSMTKMSNNALEQDMEGSIISQTWSEIPHLDGTASLSSPPHGLAIAFRNKHHARRRLRARRLPRSMSDGEHLGMWMNMSTHSAPGVSVSQWSACRDSDATGADQSDAPPYEWDDYNPPAKAEDEWDEENDREDISVLTIEDDFHMQLGTSHSSFPAHLHASNPPPSFNDENRTPVKEKVLRPVATVAGKCAPKHLNANSIDKWKLELAKTRALKKPIFKILNNPSGFRHFSESDLGNAVNTINSSDENGSIECTTTHSLPPSSLSQQSPLPTILSKIEKFASSLRLIQHDDSGYGSSLSTLSSIRSLGDVISTLKIFNDIHERLLEEQEELQSLLSSDSFSGDLSGLLEEFEPLCRGYEEAVERVEQLMAKVEAIRDKWNDWADSQRIMQTMMRTIESDLSELRSGADNSQQICSELELCQERMNRLETVCNYLSCNLAALHHRSSTQSPIDFESELALYSNALIQLKTRFEKEMGHAKNADKATLVRSRKRVHLNNGKKILFEQGTCMDTATTTSNFHMGWPIKVLFIFAVIAAFTAWFATSSHVPWRTTIGPHLDYVNGPPPL